MIAALAVTDEMTWAHRLGLRCSDSIVLVQLHISMILASLYQDTFLAS